MTLILKMMKMTTIDSTTRSIRESFNLTSYKTYRVKFTGVFMMLEDSHHTAHFVKARCILGMCHALFMALVGTYRYYLKFKGEWYLRIWEKTR